MNWHDDPELGAALAERNARAGLVRTAVIWTPLFVIIAAALIYFTVDELTGGDRGSWFLVVVLAIFSLLLGFQSLQPLFDLFGEPADLTGVIARRWSKTDSLVLRSHYIRIDRKIFRIDRDIHGDLQEGDAVHVRYYPRSAAVISVKRVPQVAESE